MWEIKISIKMKLDLQQLFLILHFVYSKFIRIFNQIFQIHILYIKYTLIIANAHPRYQKEQQYAFFYIWQIKNISIIFTFFGIFEGLKGLKTCFFAFLRGFGGKGKYILFILRLWYLLDVRRLHHLTNRFCPIKLKYCEGPLLGHKIMP